MKEKSERLSNLSVINNGQAKTINYKCVCPEIFRHLNLCDEQKLQNYCRNQRVSPKQNWQEQTKL